MFVRGNYLFSTTTPSRSSFVIDLYLSINFNVVSVASVPEFVKKTLPFFRSYELISLRIQSQLDLKNEREDATIL